MSGLFGVVHHQNPSTVSTVDSVNPARERLQTPFGDEGKTSVVSGKVSEPAGVKLSKTSRRSPAQMFHSFRNQPIDDFGPEINYDSREEICYVVSAHEAALFHCKVYILAACYMVRGLRKLALQKLHETLKVIQNQESRSVILEVHIEMMGQIYSKDVNKAAPTGSALRQMIAWFAACHMEFLQADLSFNELLERTPELGADLVAKRI